MIARRALAALLLWGGLARAQLPVVRLVDPGPGPGPQILGRALAGPHVLVSPAPGRAVLPHDSTYHTTVIVLGREAAVEGTVTGDLIVVGGDLHIHPRATINGRAIAIGGAVYVSAMATVGGGVASFRDFTYDVTPVDGGYELRYLSLIDRPESAITWPGMYGIRLPRYDRTNGLSMSLAPLVAVPGTRLLVDPRVTYRSQLGRFDPSVGAKLPFDSRTMLSAGVERATFSNDAWIWPDAVNSVATIVIGDDSRNYYRATRAHVSMSREWRWSGTTTLAPYLGARWERAESARPDSTALGGPWSIDGRHDRLDMLRANPAIDSGTIVSAVIGARFDQSTGGVTTRMVLDVEVGGLSPAFGSADAVSRSFSQATLDATITFPTLGTQSLRFDGHAVATWSGELPHDRVVSPPNTTLRRAAPRQRWAYLGGWGTIPTLNLLARGGDELIYLDGRYNIPLAALELPFVGAPIVTLRTVLGGADVARWPSLAQATGVRVSLSVAYVEYLIDPANRHKFIGLGLSMAR